MLLTLNVSDREDVLESLKLWEKRLAQARKAAGHVVTHREAIPIRVARSMVARREAQAKKLKGPRGATVAWALNRVGTREHPPESNHGPKIDEWLAHFGFNWTGQGPPWCGIFVGNALERAGHVDVSTRIAYCPYIVEDAEKQRYGMEKVLWRAGHWMPGVQVAHTGELVVFNFGSGIARHVGILRSPWKGSGTLPTVEGNTSFGTAGSQDNGGCVARRDRDARDVLAIVRPHYS